MCYSCIVPCFFPFQGGSTSNIKPHPQSGIYVRIPYFIRYTIRSDVVPSPPSQPYLDFEVLPGRFLRISVLLHSSFGCLQSCPLGCFSTPIVHTPPSSSGHPPVSLSLLGPSVTPVPPPCVTGPPNILPETETGATLRRTPPNFVPVPPSTLD